MAITEKKSIPGPGDTIPYILLFFYVAAGLLPAFGAIEVTGTQWLLLSILNIFSIAFIIWKKENFAPAARQIARSLFFILYFVLFLIVGLSILAAFNKTESIVSFVRFTNTLSAFLVMAILLSGRDYLFTLIAKVITGILLYQSLQALFPFFRDLGVVPLDELILNLKGNVGNKNILAASLVIKIPFALFTLVNSKWPGKLLCGLIAGVASLTVFLINSRSAYLSFLMILLLFLIFLGSRYFKKHESLSSALTQAGFTIIPIVISFFLSTLVIKANIETSQSPYGTFTERLGDIGFSDKASNGRNFLWTHAIDYIKKKPLLGCGYGNWKLQAIQYDRIYFDDFVVSYNVHNDFLEMTAESGIIAGAFYLLLFGILAFYTLKTWLSKREEKYKNLSFFSLMALSVYFIDALLNFPHEMPFMQTFFALSAAMIVNSFVQFKKNTDESFTRRTIHFLFLYPWIVISIIAGWVCLQTYRSMVTQAFVDRDLRLERPIGKAETILRKFPSLPNLNVRTVPIDLFRAIYLYEDKKYEESLNCLDKCDKTNPWMATVQLMRSRVYEALSKPDSAYSAAIRGYFAMPRALAGYRQLNSMCYKMKDTLTLNNAFDEIRKYRNESWVWRDYITYMQWMAAPKEKLFLMTDSAVALFPEKKYWPVIRSTLEKGDTLMLVPHVGEDR